MVEVGFMQTAGRDIEQAIRDFEVAEENRRYQEVYMAFLRDFQGNNAQSSSSQEPWWQDRLDLSATPTQAASSGLRCAREGATASSVAQKNGKNEEEEEHEEEEDEEEEEEEEEDKDSNSSSSSKDGQSHHRDGGRAWCKHDLLSDSTLRAQGWETILVQAFMLSGRLACELRCHPAMTVGMVKWHISRSCQIPEVEQQLVHDGEVLEDERCLQDHLSSGDQPSDRSLVLQIIRTPRSTLSQALAAEGREGSTKPEQAVQGSLGPVVDSVMAFEHDLSERRRPRSAEGIEAAISQAKRGDLVNWMVMACHVLKFDDSILHSAVLNADRYYESLDGPLEMMATQSILLGIFSSELKLFGADHFPRNHWKHVIKHLAHSRVPLPEILRMEYEVLAALDFCMEVPTPLTFVRKLGMQVPPLVEVGCRAVELATFFLELSMFRAHFQYSRAHSVLAAGALSAAYRILEMTEEVSADDCKAVRASLVQDLQIYNKKLPHPEDEVLLAEQEILQIWGQAARLEGGEIEWRLHYNSLQAKFSERSKLPFDGQSAAALAARTAIACQAAQE